MLYLRIFAVIFFLLMLFVKTNNIEINLIHDTTLHYIFNGSLLFLMFNIILPIVTTIKLKIWKAKSDEYSKKINIDGKVVDVYLATNIFTDNAIVLYGWNNPVIVLGENIVEKLNDSQIEFIISHETFHIKDNHLIKSFISVFFAMVLAPIIILNLSSLTINYSLAITIFLCSSLYITTLFLHYSLLRRNEFKADIYAAGIVGKEIAISTLNHLKGIHSIKENKISMLETHPSVKRRIKKIAENA